MNGGVRMGFVSENYKRRGCEKVIYTGVGLIYILLRMVKLGVMLKAQFKEQTIV